MPVIETTREAKNPTPAERRATCASLVALKQFTSETGVSPATMWRFRRKGWLKVINICGRLYIDQDGIAEFTERAKRGDFAKIHKTPSRKTAVG